MILVAEDNEINQIVIEETLLQGGHEFRIFDDGQKLMLALRNELPYDLTVETEDWQEFQNGAVRISQVISLTRDSQKPIVIGKQGSRIRQIREAAQKELQAIYECPVHLFIHVKVRPGWDEDRGHYRDLGLDFNA